MAFSSGNLMRMKGNLNTIKQHIEKVRAHAEGKNEDSPTSMMRDIALVFKNSIVETYISTYSNKPITVSKRTFSLEKALDYYYVKKNGNTVYMAVTRSWLWPLGSGIYLGGGQYYGRSLHYALTQEEGGEAEYVTASGERIPKPNWGTIHPRHFILAGRMALENYAPAARLAAYKRWIA